MFILISYLNDFPSPFPVKNNDPFTWILKRKPIPRLSVTYVSNLQVIIHSSFISNLHLEINFKM